MFWHRIVAISIAHSKAPLSSQCYPEGELRKFIFIGEMEITQSAGNLKALGSPEIFLFLFLGNRSQISFWLTGLNLTDKPGKYEGTCLPASCQWANHKLFGFPPNRYLLCMCYSVHGMEHLKCLILYVWTPCFLLDCDGFAMNTKSVVSTPHASTKKM